ncbi:MAG: hypothetical protein H6838_05085 [Planctomycetes bacterium]|nr:hypothetical protein [Planctomycetota bacterium]
MRPFTGQVLLRVPSMRVRYRVQTTHALRACVVCTRYRTHVAMLVAMADPLAQVSFETTLSERVDVITRMSRRMLGRFFWMFPCTLALLGVLVIAVLPPLLDPEMSQPEALGLAAITLAVLAVVLPPLLLLVPRITARIAIRRVAGTAPTPVTVTLTEDEISSRDPMVCMSMPWANVLRIDRERSHIVIAGRAATFFVPERAFGDDAARAAFLELAQRLAAAARRGPTHA